jgi:hypothetical protein
MTDEWKLQSGPDAPDWFKEAVFAARVEPVDPVTNDWFRHGAKIVATGQIIPLGGTITKEMVR